VFEPTRIRKRVRPELFHGALLFAEREGR
jgi:hypothetical protein